MQEDKSQYILKKNAGSRFYLNVKCRLNTKILNALSCISIVIWSEKTKHQIKISYEPNSIYGPFVERKENYVIRQNYDQKFPLNEWVQADDLTDELFELCDSGDEVPYKFWEPLSRVWKSIC